MGRVLRRPQAREDLIEIYLYVAQHAPARAEIYLDDIETKLNQLSDAPMMAPRRIEGRPDIRAVPIGNHVVVYRPIEDGIEVVRVLHSKRNWMQMFGDPKDDG